MADRISPFAEYLARALLLDALPGFRSSCWHPGRRLPAAARFGSRIALKGKACPGSRDRFASMQTSAFKSDVMRGLPCKLWFDTGSTFLASRGCTTIGPRVYGEQVSLHGRGNFAIGEDTQIGAGTKIVAFTHALTFEMPDTSKGREIGAKVWLGANVVASVLAKYVRTIESTS